MSASRFHAPWRGSLGEWLVLTEIHHHAGLHWFPTELACGWHFLCCAVAGWVSVCVCVFKFSGKKIYIKVKMYCTLHTAWISTSESNFMRYQSILFSQGCHPSAYADNDEWLPFSGVTGCLIRVPDFTIKATVNLKLDIYVYLNTHTYIDTFKSGLFPQYRVASSQPVDVFTTNRGAANIPLYPPPCFASQPFHILHFIYFF